MNGRIKTSYRGWDITVRCLNLRRGGDPAAPGPCTGSALAVLRDLNDSHNWVDFRSQRSTVTDRIFDSTASCAESLLEEVKILIDAMCKSKAAAA